LKFYEKVFVLLTRLLIYATISVINRKGGTKSGNDFI